jgi:tRNA-Thr(GGU) m(6)t(6)A37 methyltransferase TsaA
MEFLLYPIGYVRSSLKDLSQCPHQGREGAPEARIEIAAQYIEALSGLKAGAEIVILTWMHLADRSVLKVHPQKNKAKPLTGVFATRAPDRPNPIGLHKVEIVTVETSGLLVRPLEALDGTPIIDIKIALPKDI